MKRSFLLVCFIIVLYAYSITFILCCRLVCLRVHPMFTLLHPTESYVSFTSIDGSKHEVWPESGEQFYEGDLLPNGKLPIFISTFSYERQSYFIIIKYVCRLNASSTILHEIFSFDHELPWCFMCVQVWILSLILASFDEFKMVKPLLNYIETPT